MTIQILGTGCPKCKRLEENTRKAANELNLTCEIEKVTDLNEIFEYGIMMTPDHAINMDVKSVDKVLTPDQIIEIIQKDTTEPFFPYPENVILFLTFVTLL